MQNTDQLAQTRMQIINPSAGGIYTGISNAVSTIARLEGLRTLWRGVSSVIVGAGEKCSAATLGQKLMVDRSGACSLLRDL